MKVKKIIIIVGIFVILAGAGLFFISSHKKQKPVNMGVTISVSGTTEDEECCNAFYQENKCEVGDSVSLNTASIQITEIEPDGTVHFVVLSGSVSLDGKEIKEGVLKFKESVCFGIPYGSADVFVTQKWKLDD